jgi:hypothetical protein
VEIAVKMEPGRKHALFIVRPVLVYRSFYGIRIPEMKKTPTS